MAEENNTLVEPPVAPLPSSPPMLEWVQRLFNQENVTSAFQFIKGPVLAAAAAFGSPLAVAFSGAALVGVGIYKSHYMHENIKKRLLKLYRHEISNVLNKDIESLSVADLVPASQALGEDNALSIRLKHAEHEKHYFTALSIVTTVAMTALTVLLQSTGIIAGSTFKESFGIIASSFVGRAAHEALKPLVSGMVEEPKPYTVNESIRRIASQLKLGKAHPEQVFAVFVEANPQLQREIKRRYGDDYYELSLAAKHDVINAKEAQWHTKALTNAINGQQMRPTELGFIAYKSSSGLQRPLKPEAPPVAEAEEELLTRHRDQVRLSQHEAPGRVLH